MHNIRTFIHICVHTNIHTYIHKDIHKDIHTQASILQYTPELIPLCRREYNSRMISLAYHHTLKWASQTMA